MRIPGHKYYEMAALAAIACCLLRPYAYGAPEQNGLLSRAAKQIETQYFSPEKAGMRLEPAHLLFLEQTLGGISRPYAIAESTATGKLLGRINFEWLTMSAAQPVPALYAAFTATMLENGIVENIEFPINNLKEWSAEIAALLSEHKKGSSATAAINAAAAALEKRGFARAFPVPVISWEEGIATGLQPPAWSGFPVCAFSAESSRAKIGIMAENDGGEAGIQMPKHHYFTVELSAYEPAAGKWTKAEVVSEEIWEGFKPQGRKTGFSAARYFLW